MKRLACEYKQYQQDINSYYILEPTDNMLIWNVYIFGPPDSIYDGGMFNGTLRFTTTYPIEPPQFTIHNLPHPNIYPDGKVCMSILHSNIDITGYEHISERWNPTHSINSIIMSFITILVQPNLESPADIDINKLYINDFKQYKKIIYKIIANQ